jgi:hypothetical protein
MERASDAAGIRGAAGVARSAVIPPVHGTFDSTPVQAFSR